MHKIVPIKRNNKFFSKEDFDFELDLGMEYLMEDVNQTVVLYEVDLEKTNINYIYNESKKNNIRFKQPKEINVIYEIEDSKIKSYDNKTSAGLYSIIGNLKFGVFQKTLDDKKCDIKRGDYIGVQLTNDKMYYFVVADDGRVNGDNSHTMWGTVPIWRTVLCVPCDENEFNGQ